MSNQVIVIGSFALVYAASIGYAIFLHRRLKRAAE